MSRVILSATALLAAVCLLAGSTTTARQVSARMPAVAGAYYPDDPGKLLQSVRGYFDAADAPDTITKVARFLALLELFREGAVAFEQLTPLGELTIRWTGSDEGEIEVDDEYDDHADAHPPAVEEVEEMTEDEETA